MWVSPSNCPLDQYAIREYEYFSTQSAPAAGQASEAPYAIGQGVEGGYYVYLWPTFMLNIYPGPGNVSLNLIQPIGVGRTLAHYQYCFVEAVEDPTIDEFVSFIDQVQREDTVLCESVQRGLRSGFFYQGKLLLTRERALQHFQLLVYRFMRADEPTSGPV